MGGQEQQVRRRRPVGHLVELIEGVDLAVQERVVGLAVGARDDEREIGLAQDGGAELKTVAAIAPNAAKGASLTRKPTT